MPRAADLALAAEPHRLFELAGQEADPWQRQVLEARGHVQLVIHRQAGKSTVAGAKAVHRAVFLPPRMVIIISPTLRQSMEVYRKARVFYDALPGHLRPAAVKETQSELELVNGSRIISLPGSEETTRGYSGVTDLILDEGAWISDALYAGVYPMISTVDGKILAMSTPFGQRGWFWELWDHGVRGETAGTWSHVLRPADGTGRITAGFLRTARLELGQWWFDQEYRCQFLAPIGAAFDLDAVLQAVEGGAPALFSADPGATSEMLSPLTPPLFRRS